MKLMQYLQNFLTVYIDYCFSLRCIIFVVSQTKPNSFKFLWYLKNIISCCIIINDRNSSYL